MIFNLGGREDAKEQVDGVDEPTRTVEAETLQRWRAATRREGPVSAAIPLAQMVERVEVEGVRRKPAWVRESMTESMERVTVKPAAPPQKATSIDDELRTRFGDELCPALGSGTVMEGTFSFSAPARVDGVLKGTVAATSALVVGEPATVEGTIKVGSLIVFGKVQGTVQAEDLVEVRSTGTLEADLKTKRLVIEEGGVFRGKCNV